MSAGAGVSKAVTFVFRAPGATSVSLVGDFNGWNPDAMPLKRAALGDTWITQVPLERGLHVYAFVIDGSDWKTDPSAPLAPVASFGRRNSLMLVDEEGAL
jgi:1,4-alpha-glucan branching enzyme